MEKRNLFSLIFNKPKKQQEQTRTYLEMLSGYNPHFSTVSENVYDNKVVRECIDRIATHCAKLIPRHIQNSVANPINGEINFLLSNQPNPIMNTFDFIYKTISMLYSDSNAFIYIAKDKDGFITGFYPVLALNYDLYQDNDKKIYLKFRFINGQEYTLPYMELIHLRLFYNKHDIYGTSNKILKSDMETAVASSEGIKNAIKITNNLKGIIKYTNSMLKEKDIKENKDNFVKDFLSLENQSGIAALDAKAEFQEVNIKPVTLDKAQLEQVNYNIFDYFGLSEKIIKNGFNTEEWNAFFEGVIEPRAIQMGYEFTNKIFSRQARKEGHKIVFTANRLQYASVPEKTRLLATILPYGMLTTDMAREIIDMPPIGGAEGSKILQSLNNINSKIADNYQGGE